MAGRDDLGVRAPVGLAGGDAVGEGMPGFYHLPRLARGKEFQAESAEAMNEIATFRVTFAGESSACPPKQRGAAFEGFDIPLWMVVLSLLDAGAKFLAHPTPRHDLIEKGVAVGGKQSAIGGVAVMGGRDVGVVIAGDEGHRRDPFAEELLNLREFLGRHAGLIVAGITVEPERGDALEHRIQLLEVSEATGGVAEMQIGKNSQHVFTAEQTDGSAEANSEASDLCDCRKCAESESCDDSFGDFGLVC